LAINEIDVPRSGKCGTAFHHLSSGTHWSRLRLVGGHACSESFAHRCVYRSGLGHVCSEMTCPSIGLTARCSAHHHPGGTSPSPAGAAQRTPQGRDGRPVVSGHQFRRVAHRTSLAYFAPAKAVTSCRVSTLANRSVPAQHASSTVRRFDQRTSLDRGQTLRNSHGREPATMFPSCNTTPRSEM